MEIEKVYNSFIEKISAMTDEEWDKYRENLLSSFEDKTAEERDILVANLSNITHDRFIAIQNKKLKQNNVELVSTLETDGDGNQRFCVQLKKC